MRSWADPFTRPKEATFPCVMRGKTTKCIALMHRPGCGTILHPGDSTYPVGLLKEDIVMANFEPYRGLVTIDTDN